MKQKISQTCNYYKLVSTDYSENKNILYLVFVILAAGYPVIFSLINKKKKTTVFEFFLQCEMSVYT